MSRPLMASAVFALMLQTPATRADVRPLPQSQWPHTVAAAVPLVLAVMSPTQRFIIRDTPKENLPLFQGEWGDDIEHLLGLDKGNSALVTAACAAPCPIDQATLKVMEAVWDALAK